MSRRLAVLVTASIGSVSIAAAAGLAWVVVPGQEQLPAHHTSTRSYAGSASTLVNGAALAAGAAGAAFLHGVPVTIRETVATPATAGARAVVTDSTVVSGPTGPLSATERRYALNRHTFEPAAPLPGAGAVSAQRGLTINWPFGAGRQTYQVWVPETGTSVAARFTGLATVAG
ncbi:MAG: porin PorA family protein, partial [Mycobacteriales bacterium]